MALLGIKLIDSSQCKRKQQLFQISKNNKKYKVWTRQYRKSQVHDKNIS